MSKKFRDDSVRRKYSVRTFLRRILSCGLTSLLVVACLTSLYVFYILMDYQVGQSIELGYMKNVYIRSTTMAQLKQNDLEMMSSDLSVTANLISHLISYPDIVADPNFKSSYQERVIDGPAMSLCKSKPCTNGIDDFEYVFYFNGEITQNNRPKEDWNRS